MVYASDVKQKKRLIRLGGVFGDAFGNPVVEVEGPFADDFTTFNWQFKEHRDGEIAKFRGAGFDAIVIDQDGDGSIWEVKRLGKIIAKGSDCGFDPPHFFACLQAAETAIRRETGRTKAGILARRAYGVSENKQVNPRIGR